MDTNSMSLFSNALGRMLAPFAIALLLLTGSAAAGIISPATVAPAASAQELLTEEDFLPDEFSDEVGLGQGDLRTTIGRIINVALSFLGVIAVVIMLYGGFVWMTAGGNDDKVKKAQKIIVAGAIGLALIFTAYAITAFVISQLVQATSFE